MRTTVESIAASETYALRSLVLRGQDSSIPCPFLGDEADTTFHLAVKIDSRPVSIASFFAHPNSRLPGDRMIQLRGMATHPGFRGRAFAKNIVDYAISFFRNRDMELIWCNARIHAAGFYQAQGFQEFGPDFNIAGIGVHRVMYVELCM